MAELAAIETFKLVVVGGGGVGKSCMTIQFVNNVFVESWDPTIEDSYTKELTVDDKPVKIEIVDTAGQEEFAYLREDYMRAGHGFLIVFDWSSPKSFEEAEKFRRTILKVKDADAVPMTIVGNKSDLPDESKVISLEHVKSTVSSWHLPNYPVEFVAASAKTRTNVDEAFHSLIRLIRHYRESASANAGADTTAAGDEKSSGKGNKNKPKSGVKKPCTIL